MQMWDFNLAVLCIFTVKNQPRILIKLEFTTALIICSVSILMGPFA